MCITHVIFILSFTLSFALEISLVLDLIICMFLNYHSIQHCIKRALCDHGENVDSHLDKSVLAKEFRIYTMSTKHDLSHFCKIVQSHH